MTPTDFRVHHTLVVAAAVLAAASQPSAEACTGIRLKNSDGSFVHGRTVEFGIPIEMDIAYVPAGQSFTGTTPLGEGLAWEAKHAAIGLVCFGNPGIMDGLNDQGLAAAAFYFPTFASYAETTEENRARSLSPVDFSNWILTNFADVAELRAAIEADTVVVAPTIVPGWPAEPQPFHWVVYDAAGRCLVIEPVGGRLVLHDNPLGSFTNSPTFDWHLTNLRNYLSLEPLDVPKVELEGLTLEALGLGGSLLGLPGDFSSPSRFVRASFYCVTAEPAEDGIGGVLSGFHLLNQFDIPLGAVRSAHGDTTETDSTQLTLMRDPAARRLYYRTRGDQAIRFVDLDDVDPAAGLQRFSTVSTQTVLDMRPAFEAWPAK
jgi:choloylglycine hydrolase